MKNLVAISFIFSLAACGESNYEACLRVETKNQQELLDNNAIYRAANLLEALLNDYIEYLAIRGKLLEELEDSGACKDKNLHEYYTCEERLKVLEKSAEISKKEGYGEAVNLFNEINSIISGNKNYQKELIEYRNNNFYRNNSFEDKIKEPITKELIEISIKTDLYWLYKKASEEIGFPGVDKETLAKLVVKTCNERGMYR